MGMKKTTGGMSRRSFLRRAAASGAAAFPLIAPARALGLNGRTPPSEQITIGCIGVGSMGKSNLGAFLNQPTARPIAACDVDGNRLEEVRTILNNHFSVTDTGAYKDFRDLLDRDDLDAVSIALPDHWHSIPAIMAADRGLDIYAEKPLALTIAEGRAMCDAVERNATIWQTGSWQRSRPNFRRACELVRSGYIGKVHTVEVGLPTGSTCPPQPEQPVPEYFDYDMWLGPAPEAPYTELRCHWNFRWILDYSGGQLTDWAAHHVDIANWGMGTEHTGPRRVRGEGEFPREGLWNAAVNYKVWAEYGPGESPVAPDGFMMVVSNSFPMGARFKGDGGEVYVKRGNVLETKPVELKDQQPLPGEVRLYESPGHQADFLHCMRTRESTITPIEPAHRAISVAHLGNIAMRLEREVAWDPVAERFIGDAEADNMLLRAMRGPWHL